MKDDSPYQSPKELDQPEVFPRYSWPVRIAMAISVVLIITFLSVVASVIWEELEASETIFVRPTPVPYQLIRRPTSNATDTLRHRFYIGGSTAFAKSEAENLESVPLPMSASFWPAGS